MNETNAGGVRRRSVEIVVPVHNEAHVLADSTGRLHAYLEESFPFPFRHGRHLDGGDRPDPAPAARARAPRPVSMGGWSGSDDAMTLAKLKSLVKAGKLHYVIVSGDGGQGTDSEIAAWVKKHGTAVKSSAHKGGSGTSSTSTSTSSGLYRLDASDVS